MRRRPLPWPLLLLGLTMCPQISTQELACEEAKAHLERCCPGLDAVLLDCQDTSGELLGCDQVNIGTGDARCVVSRSCATLEADGTCARAADRWGGTGVPSTWSPTVCAP